jgi:hypothetical protein
LDPWSLSPLRLRPDTHLFLEKAAFGRPFSLSFAVLWDAGLQRLYQKKPAFRGVNNFFKQSEEKGLTILW